MSPFPLHQELLTRKHSQLRNGRDPSSLDCKPSRVDFVCLSESTANSKCLMNTAELTIYF